MAIDRDSAVPLYKQLADELRNEIYAEKWTKGEQISTESQIMKEYNLSRGTVKKAVGELVQEGLLEQIQGKGTFVTNDEISFPLGRGLLSFAESLDSSRLDYQTEVLESSIKETTEEIARQLQLEKGESYFYLKRLRIVENEKVMVIENRINHHIFPEITEIDFTNKSLFSVIEELSGKKIEYAKSKYAARVIGEERGKLLEVEANAPVLHLEQTVYLTSNIPVEFGNVWLKGNKYYLGTTVQRSLI